MEAGSSAQGMRPNSFHKAAGGAAACGVSGKTVGDKQQGGNKDQAKNNEIGHFTFTFLHILQFLLNYFTAVETPLQTYSNMKNKNLAAPINGPANSKLTRTHPRSLLK